MGWWLFSSIILPEHLRVESWALTKEDYLPEKDRREVCQINANQTLI
jgi:hypothetical protein